MKQQARRILRQTEKHFKDWTRPGSEGLLTGSVVDLTRSKPELMAEHALLRQQLIVLQRQIKQPKLKPKDRWLLVLLAVSVHRGKGMMS